MPPLRYNPKRINNSWVPDGETINFQGFMDGTFVEVEFDESQITTHTGADGTTTFILNANETATATVTIVQGSPTNDDFSENLPSARFDRMPGGPWNLSDLNGFSLVTSEFAVIEKVAKVDFGKGVVGRAWKFKLHQAQIIAGGDDS